MARKKDENHKPEMLISIVERYITEKDPCKRPKYSQLGEFARSIGFDIGNHIFQKSTNVREYLDTAFSSSKASCRLTVAVYDTLDTERFIATNNTPQKLKNALHERDNYYKKVVLSAGQAFDENDELRKRIDALNDENRKLKADNISLSEELDSIKKQVRDLKSKEKKLRDIVDTWVNPEIANEMLRQEGLLKDTAEIIKPEMMEKKTITGSSNIKGLIATMYKQVDTV